MKLFWSMRPLKNLGLPPHLFGPPLAPTAVTIRAFVNGRRVASAVLMRRGAAAGVTWRDTTLAGEGFVGTYWAAEAGPPAPAVLQLSGSEGRHTYIPAAVLASHGYPTLSLAYFKEPGLPKTLKNIPLEYFSKALHWLAVQPGVDPNRVIASRVAVRQPSLLVQLIRTWLMAFSRQRRVPTSAALTRRQGMLGR